MTSDTPDSLMSPGPDAEAAGAGQRVPDLTILDGGRATSGDNDLTVQYELTVTIELLNGDAIVRIDEP